MSTTTLTVTRPVTLDGNGNGTVILRPDTGQNWAPLFVRVSTGTKATPVAYCAVYHGLPGVPGQPSQFIDDTFLGSGDTSSMIAGTPILYGEAIIFNFQNGTPGDVAVASVYGMQSDLPPNLSLSPQVPGTHFVGHLSTEISTQANFVPASAPFTVGPNATLFLTIGVGFGSGLTGTPDDVRQYSSYYLKIFSTAHTAPTAFSTSRVDLFFYGSSNTGNGTLVYQDMAEWWNDSAFPGTFNLANSDVLIQDVLHGPYLVVQYTNGSSTTSMDVNFLLEYSTRLIPGPYLRQQKAIDGTLAATGNVGTAINSTVNLPLPLSDGRMRYKANSLGPGTITVNTMYGSLAPVIDQDVMASAALVTRELIVPKRAIMVQVVTGGTAGGYAIDVFTQFDKV